MQYIHRKKTMKCEASCWSVFSPTGAYVPEGLMTSCSWDYMTFTPSVRSYTMLLFTFVFFIPLSIIIFSYCCIFRAIRHTTRLVYAHTVFAFSHASISFALQHPLLHALINTWRPGGACVDFDVVLINGMSAGFFRPIPADISLNLNTNGAFMVGCGNVVWLGTIGVFVLVNYLSCQKMCVCVYQSNNEDQLWGNQRLCKKVP